MASTNFLLINGVPVTANNTPSISTLLQTTSGAYTTTRTHNNLSTLLFPHLHLLRLSSSIRILSQTRPALLGSGSTSTYPLHTLEPKLRASLKTALQLAIRNCSNELAVTALVSGLDLYLHVGYYMPPVFGVGGARLGIAGPGREVAVAKYSDWARIRKGLEKRRPAGVTEMLLSNDGDRILEGCVTNFFVVCRRRKVVNDITNASSYGSETQDSLEVQTAPISDGVLPGVIRQLVIEICLGCGIPLREVAPSWSDREIWEEAFVTSSLRLLQHVETIQAPILNEDLETGKEVPLVEKRFEGAGVITTQIQEEIMAKAEAYGYKLSNLF